MRGEWVAGKRPACGSHKSMVWEGGCGGATARARPAAGVT